MKKISKIIIPLFLLLLTVFTVAAPRIVSAVTDRRLFEEKAEWNFSRNDSAGISEAQVAELYRTGQLDLYYPLMYDAQKYGTEYLSEVPESVYRLLGNLFGEESETYAYLKEIFSLGDFSGLQKKSILVIDDRPVALNTVTVQITNKSGCVINMVYEERTLVPVRIFIQYSYSPEYGFWPPDTSLLENVLRDYSYTVFSLEPGEYVLYNDSYDYEGIKSGNFLYSIAASQPESDYNLK